MGKKHKRHHRSDKEELGDIEDVQAEKPSGLKLVLKVGAPLTPSDVTPADSQSEACDSDTAVSEKKLKHSKRRHQADKIEVPEKKRRHDSNEDDSDDADDDLVDEREHLSDPAESDDLHGRSLREKRPVTFIDDDKSALQTCLDYLQKILQRKDQNGFFSFPVTENIAPGYYSIITHPMDFSTMKAKIDAGQYHSVAEYRADYQLMMENCMQYNHPETVYHREAKRLLTVGMKHMSREHLLQMKRNLPSMSALTYEELGLDDETGDATPGSENKSRHTRDRSSQRKQALSHFEAIPDKMSPEEILRQAQAAAKAAADKLVLRAPNSKIGFLRRREDGSTSLKILNPDNDGLVSEKERVVSLGDLIGKVQTGAGSLTGLRDDKRNKVNPVNYLSYGVFSSYAPIYDSSTSNLNKEDSDLLLSTYGDEAGLQYAKSLRNFVTGEYAVHMVDNLLDILTDGEHSKTNATLLQREQQKLRLEQEEAKKKQEMELESQQLNTDAPAESVNESQRHLDHLATLISNLHRVQNARLSRQLPQHLGELGGPSAEETELAQKLATELSQIVKQVAPSDVATVRSLRDAMGVTCEPVTTDSSTDQTPADHPCKQTELDQDVDEFFELGHVETVPLVDTSN